MDAAGEIGIDDIGLAAHDLHQCIRFRDHLDIMLIILVRLDRDLAVRDLYIERTLALTGDIELDSDLCVRRRLIGLKMLLNLCYNLFIRHDSDPLSTPASLSSDQITDPVLSFNDKLFEMTTTLACQTGFRNIPLWRRTRYFRKAGIGNRTRDLRTTNATHYRLCYASSKPTRIL